MQVLTVTVEGYLSEEQLVKLLAPVDAELERFPTEPYGVVVDILKMSGYSPEARSAYIAWHQRLQQNIKGVAVVTNNMLWRMVIAAIGLSVPLRAFDANPDAVRWLQGLGPRRAPARASR